MSARLNPEPKRLWLEALRSGEYEQGQEALCSLDDAGEPVDYCCMGVACEVARANGVNVPISTSSRHKRIYADTNDVLPLVVMEWLGAPSADPVLAQKSLSLLNDVTRLSFAKIADLIEAQL